MSKGLRERQRQGLLITFFSAVAFGIWPSAMRQVYADGANQSFVIVLATFLRLLPMLAISLWQRHKFFHPPSSRRDTLSGGFFQAISSACLFAAVMYVPGPIVIIILFTYTLMLLGYMIWQGEIKPDRLTIITTITALGGLCFALDLFHAPAHGSLIGYTLAFVAAVTVAMRFYVVGKQTKTKSPAHVGAENFSLATLFLLPLFLVQTPVPPATLGGAGWMALGGTMLALGTLGQFYGISLLGPFRFSLFLKMEPLFATAFGALLVGDVLKPLQYTGIAIVMGSLAFYQYKDHRRRKSHEELSSLTND